MSEGTDATGVLAGHLRPVAAQVGSDVAVSAEEARIIPDVNIGLPVGRGLAVLLGQHLSRCGIFRRGEEIVTVDEEGRMEGMSADRFVSWVEKFVTTVKYMGEGIRREMTMSGDLARKILASDQFRECLRELRGVHPVRMPVWDGEGGVRWLAPGYDEATGIFTGRAVVYGMEMGLEEARGVFVRYLQGFPWGDIPESPRDLAMAVRANRSAAVQVAAMLGTYCRGMFRPGTKRPMILYVANQPGTGKSLSAVMGLAHVFGHVGAAGLPRDEEKMSVLLETAAQSMQPYLFLDDVARGIFSNSLNRFITASVHKGRCFHSNSRMFEVEAVTQVVATGNGIELTPDLQRRCLVVDMFLAGEVQGRRFERLLSEDELASEGSRAELLAACAAVVRAWAEMGCPRSESVLATFEEWSAVMGGLTTVAGWADPLIQPDLPDAGDRQGRTWRLFLARLAGDGIMPGEGSRRFTVAQCLEKAEEMVGEDLFDMEDLVGGAKDAAKAFGRRIAAWKGRKIRDARGRLVEFGQRRGAHGRAYDCTVVAEAE
jgi:hypothetical protein